MEAVKYTFVSLVQTLTEQLLCLALFLALSLAMTVWMLSVVEKKYAALQKAGSDRGFHRMMLHREGF